MKTKKEKSFDAVKMMRDIRDKISTDTQNMTFSSSSNSNVVKALFFHNFNVLNL
jgi:hypothetical protein